MASSGAIPAYTDPSPPSYPHEDVPTYTPPLVGSAVAAFPTDSSPFSKFYFQREETFPSRQGLIVTFSADPTLCRPVYTVKHHGQRISLIPGTSQPDLTLYRGSDTHGQVLATGAIKSSILSRIVAEVKLFGVSGGSDKIVHTLSMPRDKKTNAAVWTWRDGRRLAWNMTVSMKPPSNAIPAPSPASPPPTTISGKLRVAMAECPEILFHSYKGVLMEADKPGAELAVYEDMVPHNPPMTRELLFKDGHAGVLEFLEPVVDDEFRDAAVAVLILMIERVKRAVVNGKRGVHGFDSSFGGFGM